MSGMTKYYLSRMVVAALLVGILLLTGSPWWFAVLLGVLTAGFFLWAPRSGRYAVAQDRSAAPLQRDEWTQTITDRAARNAFAVLMLAIGAVAVCFGSILKTDVPLWVVSLLGLLGAAVYFVSDLWLRRL